MPSDLPINDAIVVKPLSQNLDVRGSSMPVEALVAASFPSGLKSKTTATFCPGSFRSRSICVLIWLIRPSLIGLSRHKRAIDLARFLGRGRPDREQAQEQGDDRGNSKLGGVQEAHGTLSPVDGNAGRCSEACRATGRGTDGRNRPEDHRLYDSGARATTEAVTGPARTFPGSSPAQFGFIHSNCEGPCPATGILMSVSLCRSRPCRNRACASTAVAGGQGPTHLRCKAPLRKSKPLQLGQAGGIQEFIPSAIVDRVVAEVEFGELMK